MEETKVCKVCGRELPLTKFRLSKCGNPVDTCNECIASKRAETRRNHRIRGGGAVTAPFSDPDFDGLHPGEVWRKMCSAKKWLESRGFVIQLDGEYRETKVRKLKLE